MSATVWHVALDLLREALHRRWVLALAIAITACVTLLGFTLEMEVVDGVLAGTRLFGNVLSHELRATDMALRPVFEAVAWTIYVVGLIFGVLSCSDFAPELVAPGRIELLLALPIRRWELLLGTYLGVLSLAGACTAYATLSLTVLIGVKSGIWSWSILAGGLAACTAFTAVYGAMLATAVFVRSAALSAAVGGVLLAAGAGLTRPELTALLDPGVGRMLFSGAVSVLPRFWLLGRLGLVAGGYETFDADLVRTIAGTLVFGLGCVVFAIWEFERRDY